MNISWRTLIRIGALAAGTLVIACSDPMQPGYQPSPDGSDASVVATPITSCGTVISAAGRYRLTADLLNCGSSGITVTASNVSIDLLGHTIRGSSVFVGGGIVVGVGVSGGVTNFHLEGPGSIENFNAGIAFEQVRNSAVRRVSVQGNFFGIGVNAGFGAGEMARSTDNEFTGLTVSGNWAHGVTSNGGDRNIYQNDTFTDNGQYYGGHGIYLYAASNNTVKNNVVTGTGLAGIFTEGSNVDPTNAGNKITGNTVSGSGWLDMLDGWYDCTHNTWSGNSAANKYPSCLN